MVQKFYVDFFHYRILSSGHDYKGVVWDSEVPLWVIILFTVIMNSFIKEVPII